MSNKAKGAALVIVVFIAAILASMTMLMIIKTKQHIERIAIAKQYMQAERELVTDLSHLIFLTQTSPYSIMGDSNVTSLNRELLPEGINLQGRSFKYRNSQFSIQDMGGLISLIPLDRTLLTRYLTSKNWPSKQIHVFMDVVEDWQDNDSFKRLNGAESFEYRVFGYPLNQPLQSLKELALLANVDSELVTSLINDENVVLYSAGRSVTDYAPDVLLPAFNSEYDAKNIEKMRKEYRVQGKVIPTSHYSSGNWVIQVSSSFEQGRSSKILHVLRRFGDHRPFILTQ